MNAITLDEDSDRWIFGLKQVNSFLDKTNSSWTRDGAGWILLDSGSMVHACPPDFGAGDVQKTMGATLRTVTGGVIEHYGQKNVEMTLGDCAIRGCDGGSGHGAAVGAGGG